MKMHGKYKYLVLTGLVCSLVLVSVASVGCKKKAPQEGTPAAAAPSQPSLPPVGGMFGQTKGSLNEIIKAAKTWSPAYESSWGKPAPDLSLTDISGKEHRLSKYRGKDVLLTFWAISYGPCKLEVPELIELRNTVGADKLVMLAVSKDDASLLRSFVAQKNINYTVCTSPTVLPSPFNQVENVPSSFLIDPQGKVKVATMGKLSASEIKALLLAK